MNPPKNSIFLFFCLMSIFPLMGNSRNDENLLGPTGMFGQPNKKGIAISKVEPGSPADGKVRPGDVIIGAGLHKKLQPDPRRRMAEAIDEAETPEGGGTLTLSLEGDRKVDIPLKVMGRYSDTAPYDCAKSEVIILKAADYLMLPAKAKGNVPQFNASRGQLQTGWLGLMATGDAKCLDFVKQHLPQQDWAKPDREKLMAQVKGDQSMSYVGWYWGYQLITLAEYHLLTGDRSVLPAITAYAEALANGQDAAGLWSHRMAIWSKNNDQPHGRCIGYGQMNQPSLTCFMGLLLAKKCGVKMAEVDGAIKRAHTYFNSYTGRGTFPYGVHDPNSREFNNNGMSGSAALCMALLGNWEGAAFFSRCSAAAHDRIESGHATYYFNVLWTPLGAHVAGPDVTKQFFRESRWLKTLYRSWNGSFTHDGTESREGNSTGSQLLAYCLPRRALFITGKNADESLWLKKDEATEIVQMSKISYDKAKTETLLGYLGSPFPQVALPAIDALRTKKDEVVPAVLAMMQTGSKTQKINAIRFFGAGCPPELALPQLDKLGAMLRDETQSVEVRATAASALAHLGEPAHAYYQDMLKMVVAEEPGDPLGLTDESLAESLNTLCPDPFAAGQVKDKKLFYAAATRLMDHKRQGTRGLAMKMVTAMPEEDFRLVGDKIQYVIKDKDLTYHSYHNPSQAIGSGIAVLARFHIKEGLDYTLAIEESETGKGSFKMRTIMDSLARYGAHARPYVEKLQQRDSWKTVPDNRKLKSHWENMIKAMETDKNPSPLISWDEAKNGTQSNSSQ
jgi:hypothetical protein